MSQTNQTIKIRKLQSKRQIDFDRVATLLMVQIFFMFVITFDIAIRYGITYDERTNSRLNVYFTTFF